MTSNAILQLRRHWIGFAYGEEPWLIQHPDKLYILLPMLAKVIPPEQVMPRSWNAYAEIKNWAVVRSVGCILLRGTFMNNGRNGAQ